MSSAAYLQGYDAGRQAAAGGASQSNPYREPANKSAWETGFASAYSEFSSRHPYANERERPPK